MNIAPDFASCQLPTLEICATVLNDRIDTCLHMLRLANQYPRVLPEEVKQRYGRDFFIAHARLEVLHAELERRIGALVNL